MVSRHPNGRGGEIRTHDLYVPNVALYQAKLRPDLELSGKAGRRYNKKLTGRQGKQNIRRGLVLRKHWKYAEHCGGA